MPYRLTYIHSSRIFYFSTGGSDFDSASQTATITAGTSSDTVNIRVINDNLVEGDETFRMNLNVPTSPGITAGAITTATGIISDSTSELWLTVSQYKFIHTDSNK